MNFRNRFSVCAALLLSAAVPACGHHAKTTEKQPIPVKVRTVAKRSSAGPTRYSGSLEPATKVDMAFRVGGYVDALGVIATPKGSRTIDKGDFVTKGTVLARIRAADYEHQLATARAVVSEASASSKLAATDLDRAKKLFAAEAISKAELDSSMARADSAKAQVDDAVARAATAGLSLNDTVLRAPMDGVVLSRNIEVGSLVSPGQPAITIADVRTVKAVFGAPQSLVERLHVGSSVQVFVGAETEAKAPEKLVDARVTRISPAADFNGRVFSVEAALPNDAGMLRPGAVVAVHVPEADAPGKSRDVAGDALVVPLSAVIRSPRDPRAFSVFVLDGDGNRSAAHLRDVRLGEVTGNSVTVTEGLAANQRVVTVGSTLLRDGSDAVVIR